MLNDYIESFSNLKRDGAHQWPRETKYKSPHKPLLLLSVLVLIKEGAIRDNTILPSDDLCWRFKRYWDELGLEDLDFPADPSIHLPFWHLKNEGDLSKFWCLKPKTGMEEKIKRRPGSLEKLREIYIGAEINEDLFQYLTQGESREILREVLINEYFLKGVIS